MNSLPPGPRPFIGAAGDTVRTALVTGASRGIGRGIALDLARQRYALTITARSEAPLRSMATELEKAGAPQVHVYVADLADRAAAAELISSHQEHFQSMNALILNGGVGTAECVADVTDRRFDKTLEINLRTNMALIRNALPLLRQGATQDPARGARVIGLSSITGVYAEPGLAAYGASKAALISLLETLNAEESGNGVMATAVAPAYVDTDMSAWTAEAIPPASMITVDDVVAVVGMLIRLGANASITRIVMSRSGTSGYLA